MYDGWNIIREICDEVGSNTNINSYIWGLDINRSIQGACGVRGLLAVIDHSSSKTYYFTYDADGNVGQLIDSETGEIAAHYEYDPYGKIISSYGILKDKNPFRFNTTYIDIETGLYSHTYRYYSPNLGRWISRDPVADSLNLYSMTDNDPVNSVDPYGLWKVDRNNKAKAMVEAESRDSVNTLANNIGLDPAGYRKWLSPHLGSTIPTNVNQTVPCGNKYEIPNTAVGYWAGEAGKFGKSYVSWNNNINSLNTRGFLVDNSDHTKGTNFVLQKKLEGLSNKAELHGLYFWGHGIGPYPSPGLTNKTSDNILEYTNINLSYKMALALVYACDSNSGKTALFSNTTGGIWKGYSGTLIPHPFIKMRVEKIIKPGDQGTKK